MKEIKKEVAQGLLKIGAVFLRPEQPFTWASGIKSPIYCDNRLTLTAPEVRNAHAAIMAHITGLPMGYVRSGAKDHGRANRIEGKLEKGEKVVVVEDLISTAKSSVEVVDALREEGAEVIGMVSIFTYGMRAAKEKLAAANVKAVSLCDLDELLEVAVEEGYIPEEARGRILSFRDDPSDESWIKK